MDFKKGMLLVHFKISKITMHMYLHFKINSTFFPKLHEHFCMVRTVDWTVVGNKMGAAVFHIRLRRNGK